MTKGATDPADPSEFEARLKRYTDLYELAPVGYVTLGREGAIRTANITAARLLGRERRCLTGEPFASFISTGCRATFDAFLERVFESQATQTCEVELPRDDHTAPWVHIQASASEDGGGECRAVLVEITERRRLEDAVRFRMTLIDYAATHSLEELLRKTLDAVGALTGSSIGFYHFVEPDQKTLSLQTWSTRTIAEFCTAEGQGKHYPIDEAGVWVDCVRERRPVIHNDYPALPHRKGLPAGHAAVTRELVVPVMRSGSIVAIIGVGNKPTDYTDGDVEIVSHLAEIAWAIIERKRAEQTLLESEARYRTAAEALHEADRSKNQFFAILSHELRNPLAPITNALAILDHAVPGGDQALRAQAAIGRQVAQLSRLVDDLLDVTRMSSNKLMLKCERLELGELVRRTTDDHRPQFERSTVHITLESTARPVFVRGDWNRLAQVVGNLLQNAAKFTEPGGLTRVSVSLDTPARRAVIRIADTGAGISAEMMARLFQPFAQADTTLDRSKGGLGLGLALVKGLVELHGGDIEVQSAGLGHGSEFVVYLPLALEEEATDRVERSGPPGGRRRVLIIEDNIDAADSLREVLELCGHEVEVAYDGPDGIARARHCNPEVVLCDIGLPGMNGFEVARAFRTDEALERAFLVALSGYALPEDVERATAAGFDVHLAKPATLEKLEQALSRAPASGTAPRARA
jgi:PAS domain S-box-containing protein